MPGKAGVKGTRYTCLQCFMSHYLNDVLFMARWPSGTCDVRQAAHRYAVESDAAFTQWWTAALLNWRALPQSRRRWKDSAISAVRDMDGSWVSERVCPCCHTPPPPVRWSSAGTGREWTAKPLPTCCESASGAVVRLKVQVDEDGEWDDLEALCTVEALLEACAYADVQLSMSVLFLLEGPEDREDATERFQQKCPQLTRLIQYNFENSYFAVGVYNRPQAAVQAVEWLSGHISRMNTEE